MPSRKVWKVLWNFDSSVVKFFFIRLNLWTFHDPASIIPSMNYKNVGVEVDLELRWIYNFVYPSQASCSVKIILFAMLDEAYSKDTIFYDTKHSTILIVILDKYPWRTIHSNKNFVIHHNSMILTIVKLFPFCSSIVSSNLDLVIEFRLLSQGIQDWKVTRFSIIRMISYVKEVHSLMKEHKSVCSL